MSDREAQNGHAVPGHSARLLRGLVWTGAGLAPVAALVALVGGSSGAIRFAVLLIAVCVVLIGASLLIRIDPVLLRMDVEDRVAAEVDGLREEMRGEIAAAARATHHRVQTLQEEIGRRHAAVSEPDPARAPAGRAVAAVQPVAPEPGFPTGDVGRANAAPGAGAGRPAGGRARVVASAPGWPDTPGQGTPGVPSFHPRPRPAAAAATPYGRARPGTATVPAPGVGAASVSVPAPGVGAASVSVPPQGSASVPPPVAGTASVSFPPSVATGPAAGSASVPPPTGRASASAAIPRQSGAAAVSSAGYGAEPGDGDWSADGGAYWSAPAAEGWSAEAGTWSAGAEDAWSPAGASWEQHDRPPGHAENVGYRGRRHRADDEEPSYGVESGYEAPDPLADHYDWRAAESHGRW